VFLWDKSASILDVSADKVVHLLRSMRAVQLALPGMSVQQATAYLCQYRGGTGIVTVAAFHLEKQQRLAFYFSDPKEVPAAKADSLLDQGMNFVESMGFLLADLDFHLLSASDRDLLWGSLPLKAGVESVEVETAAPAEPAPVAAKPVAAAPAPARVVPAAQPAKAATPPPPQPKAAPAPTAPIPPASPKPAPAAVAKKVEKDVAPTATAAKEELTEGVDDLLAAVSALRANRPGLRARKTPPPPEELNRRRTEFRENLGRILASM